MIMDVKKPAHIGRNIRRIRELRGWKQEMLATAMNVSQQMISKIEQCEEVDNDTLEKIADILQVDADKILSYNDDDVIYNIQNNYEGSNNKGANGSFYNCSFNPIDKIVELFDENKKLYERLLQAEKEISNLKEKK